MAPNKPSKQRKFFVNNITHLRSDGLLKFSTKFQLYFWAIAFCEHPRCLCGQVRSRYRCISRSAKLLSMLHFNMITNYGQTGRVTKVECGALHAASSSRAAELQSCRAASDSLGHTYMARRRRSRISRATEEAAVWLL